MVLGIANENKADNLLISQKIRNDRKAFWHYLYECGLMGEKKYKNLTRNAIGEGEIKGFINRQLVETRQITEKSTACIKAAKLMIFTMHMMRFWR